MSERRDATTPAVERLRAWADRGRALHYEAGGDLYPADVLEVLDLETRVGLLEDAVRHVLRYGKVGKQSEARLRAALLASETSGEVDV